MVLRSACRRVALFDVFDAGGGECAGDFEAEDGGDEEACYGEM